MVQTPVKPITLEAFLAIPETKPASEFINGKIIQKPIPQGKHSALQLDLSALINTAVRARKIARAFPELRCTFNGRSIVPDIAVFTWEHIPTDENGETANVFALPPDWTIEILSPGQNIAKVTSKIIHCLNHGTQMGWIIDPAHKSVLTYQPHQLPAVADTAENPQVILPMPSFASELSLAVEDLFALLVL